MFLNSCLVIWWCHKLWNLSWIIFILDYLDKMIEKKRTQALIKILPGLKLLQVVGRLRKSNCLKKKTILSFSQRNVQFLIWSSSGVITVLLMGLEEWSWITSDKEAHGLWMLKQLFDTLYITVLCAANYMEKWHIKRWQTYHSKDAQKQIHSHIVV